MSLDLNAQILQALGASTPAKKQSDFVNFSLYSKKDPSVFLGTVGLLPHTKDAMIQILQGLFDVKEPNSIERKTVSLEDII